MRTPYAPLVAVSVAALVAFAPTSAVASDVAPGLTTMTVTGTLQNVVVDARDDREATAPDMLALLEVDGRLFTLPQDVASPDAATGTDVLVTLTAPADLSPVEALAVATESGPSPEAQVLSVAPLALDQTAAELAAKAPKPAGAHTITVLPVYWSAPDVSIGELTTMAAETAAYWSEQSHQKLTFTQSVRPWARIDAPATCDSAALYNAALAANPGVAAATLTNHVVVYFPASLCTWAGLANVEGGVIWINGYTDNDVIAHEFGHNLGLLHANQTTCTSGAGRVPLSATCANNEYGDSADVMGSSYGLRTGNLTIAAADFLGFANVTTIPVTGTTAPVTVSLSPLSQMTALRGIKITVPNGLVYVDFRPALGRDTRTPAWAGVQVHLQTLKYGLWPETFILDMKPTLAEPFDSAAMAAGASWEVPGGNQVITVTSVGSTAQVTVTPTSANPPPTVPPTVPPIVAPPAGPTVSGYVTRVYSDLFNRAPDSAGLANWVVALNYGVPRIAVANAITGSTEYRSSLITGSYALYLGRGPDRQGLQNWVTGMNSGMTITQMEGNFLASQEYYNQSGQSDAQWVTRLYSHVLGRPAAPSEVAGWTAVLGSGASRYDVSQGFLLSSEHLGAVVDSHYKHLLHRGIDPAGRAGWVGAIQGGARLEEIIGGIIGSAEYYGQS